jgi:hypothetical protein
VTKKKLIEVALPLDALNVASANPTFAMTSMNYDLDGLLHRASTQN